MMVIQTERKFGQSNLILVLGKRGAEFDLSCDYASLIAPTVLQLPDRIKIIWELACCRPFVFSDIAFQLSTIPSAIEVRMNVT
jgi:hypothetical protein